MTDARYTIISADCHAGADLGDYRSYLDGRWHDEFDAWAADFENPFSDLRDPGKVRNWDNEIRQRELEGDAGRASRPTTVGSPTGAASSPDAGRAWCRCSPTTSTRRSPRSSGGRRTD